MFCKRLNSYKSVQLRPGFTLLELMLTIAMTIIVLWGIGVYIVNMHHGWGMMWNRINSDVVNDAYRARRAFDGYVRKSARRVSISPDGSRVEVQYWNDPENDGDGEPDRYAIFYHDGSQLVLEHGDVFPRAVSGSEVLANNVTYCKFNLLESSIQMILTLDDSEGDDSIGNDITIMTNAIMHNQI